MSGAECARRGCPQRCWTCASKGEALAGQQHCSISEAVGACRVRLRWCALQQLLEMVQIGTKLQLHQGCDHHQSGLKSLLRPAVRPHSRRVSAAGTGRAVLSLEWFAGCAPALWLWGVWSRLLPAHHTESCKHSKCQTKESLYTSGDELLHAQCAVPLPVGLRVPTQHMSLLHKLLCACWRTWHQYISCSASLLHSSGTLHRRPSSVMRCCQMHLA